MVVHYRAEKELVAPCGYRYQRRMYGLDYARVAQPSDFHHIVVSCPECARHVPRTRKGPQRHTGFPGGFPARKVRY